MKNQPTKTKVNPIVRFLWQCSGANIKVLEQIQTEHNTYAGIGLAILLTSIFAFMSGSYALYFVFEDITSSITFGLVWSLLIFNLDRLIVSSMKVYTVHRVEQDLKDTKTMVNDLKIKSTPNLWKSSLMALPRVLLAILIGVVISKPLELKIFEKEIEVTIAKQIENRKEEFKNDINKRYNNIDTIKNEIFSLKYEIEREETELNQFYNEMIGEAEGRIGSGKVGKGSLFREKQSKYLDKKQEYENLRQQNSQRIENNDTIISRLQQEKDTDLKELNAQAENYSGLLAQLKALSYLSTEGGWWIINMVTFLFILIELGPVFVKMMHFNNNYDYLLRISEFEEKYLINSSINFIEKENVENAEKEVEKSLSLLRVANDKTIMEHFWKEITSKRIEEVNILIEEWHPSEKNSFKTLLKELNEKHLSVGESKKHLNNLKKNGKALELYSSKVDIIDALSARLISSSFSKKNVKRLEKGLEAKNILLENTSLKQNLDKVSLDFIILDITEISSNQFKKYEKIHLDDVPILPIVNSRYNYKEETFPLWITENLLYEYNINDIDSLSQYITSWTSIFVTKNHKIES